jgi:acetyltransferase-like isoleucine patch superfamily enzyme
MRRIVATIWNGSIRLLGRLVGVLAAWGTARGWLYFPFISQALSLIPFAVGWKLRREIYACVLPEMGRDAVLHFGVTLEDERTRIGNDVWVSAGAYIDYAEIGDHVLIGPHAVILAGGQQHRSDRLDIPVKLQGNHPKQPVKIGRGAWIGANATVMADVGHDAIVAAGAFVTKPAPPFAVVAGNPARVMRNRHDEATEEALAEKV